jgi:ribosomal protein L11 methyltransferase
MDYIELDFEIMPKTPAVDIVIAELGEIGFDTFEETDNGVKAYIPLKEYSEEAIHNITYISNNADHIITWQKNIIKAQNWNAVWESSFEPVVVDGKCSVRAPFHQAIAGVEFDIVIEPKMSFGTGHHETTSLVIKEMLETNFAGKTVLDMGCGTGVLAILAVKKGATYTLAIDIDEWAYENTLENIKTNNTPKIEVLKGDASLLGIKTFDVILANINRNIITRDISKYYNSLAKGGKIIFSGFLEVDIDIIIQAANKFGLDLSNKALKNHWAMLSFTRS